MVRKHIIYSFFIVLALVLVWVSFYRSANFGLDKADAGSFGISPPYVKALSIMPGQEYSQVITLMRGEAGSIRKVEVLIDAPVINNWITVEPEEVVFSKTQMIKKIKIIVRVPMNAWPENYKGNAILRLATKNSSKGVAIGVGGLIDIDIRVRDEDGKKYAQRIYEANDLSMYERLRGRFVIKTEDYGKAFYVHPLKNSIIYFGQSIDTSKTVKEQGEGITNENLNKIPIALNYFPGKDTDEDNLPDKLEMVICTNHNDSDTDKDGFFDAEEIRAGFSPLVNSEENIINEDFALKQAGRIFLAVEQNGEAWYINPLDFRRYYLGNLEEMFSVVALLGLGINNDDFNMLVK